MVVDVPIFWLVLLNLTVWPVVHLLAAWFGTQLSGNLFQPESWWYRQRSWEHDGRLYEAVFAVRRWKGLLPDGATLFRKGFPKKKLRAHDPHYMTRFARETCRGEAVHWVVIACSIAFFLWNPWWVGMIMVAYGLLANLPCIFVQRYNRIRLIRITRQRPGPDTL